MSDGIQYRMALPEDEDTLVHLWWGMQASHHQYDPVWYADKGEQISTTSWREHYRRLLQDEDTVMIVASSSGTPVGMIVAQFTARPPIYTTERIIEIASTVVHPDFRQKGIFTGMLCLLEDMARSKGIGVMHLVVHHRNEEAKHAYKSAGFIPETLGLIKWIE